MITLKRDNNSAPFTEEEEQEVSNILEVMAHCSAIKKGDPEQVLLERFLDNYSRMKEHMKELEDNLKGYKFIRMQLEAENERLKPRTPLNIPNTICNRCGKRDFLTEDEEKLCGDCWSDIHGM